MKKFDVEELVETSKKKDVVQRCWVRQALNILREEVKGEVVVEQREGEKENVVKMKTETNSYGGIGKYKSMSPGHLRTVQSVEMENERVILILRTKASEYSKERMVAQPSWDNVRP